METSSLYRDFYYTGVRYSKFDQCRAGLGSSGGSAVSAMSRLAHLIPGREHQQCWGGKHRSLTHAILLGGVKVCARCVKISTLVKKLLCLQNYSEPYPAASLTTIVALRR